MEKRDSATSHRRGRRSKPSHTASKMSEEGRCDHRTGSRVFLQATVSASCGAHRPKLPSHTRRPRAIQESSGAGCSTHLRTRLAEAQAQVALERLEASCQFARGQGAWNSSRTHRLPRLLFVGPRGGGSQAWPGRPGHGPQEACAPLPPPRAQISRSQKQRPTTASRAATPPAQGHVRRPRARACTRWVVAVWLPAADC